MDANRSFLCEFCRKAFTLKWNLKTHAKHCKGSENKTMLNCVKCERGFSSKRTLKVHVLTCLPEKVYQCNDCKENFVIYIHLHAHRERNHRSEQCDYCDVVVANGKNMRRHILTKHKGLTPSKAKQLEMRGNYESKKKAKKDYKCDKCGKSFYDKSTLNRHQKQHSFSCNICEKKFQTEKDLNSHMIMHDIVKDHTSDKVIGPKKIVVWADKIEEVKTIPITKLSVKPEMKSKLMHMFNCLEKVMPICGNRGKSLTMQEFVKMFEENSQKKFDESVFRALLSIYPDSYKVEVNKKNIHVTFVGDAKPRDIKARKLVLDKKMSDIENDRYIDLVDLPQIGKEVYKSAQQTIVENIVKFDHDEDVDTEDVGNMVGSRFELLKLKIERKNSKKKKRELKFKQIDWQFKRLSKLTNLVHKIFISETKNALKFDFLLEKIERCDYSCISIDSDLRRLIKDSNGWLRTWRGWVKKNSSIDVNDVMKLF